jgi:hypothetical protein
MTENRGKDFNYFSSVVVDISDGYFPESPQVQTAFRGARRMMFVCAAGTNVEYSFDGQHLHGRISSDQIFNFGPRAEDKIFFRGSGTVDVHIWHIGF